MKEDIKRFLPLSPAALHILLALASEDLHGYGIMLEVARQSEGQYKLGPGTLYDNLRKLMTQHCVEEVQRRAGILLLSGSGLPKRCCGFSMRPRRHAESWDYSPTGWSRC